VKLLRRKFLHLAAGAAALPALSRYAWAQAYPTRPITMIVPFAPGGISDVMGRMMAEPMRAFLGQPVIIENVGGAAGSIGVGRAVRAPGDSTGRRILRECYPAMLAAIGSVLLSIIAAFVVIGGAPRI
jgi:tripartite-type tricarboxylate transporter receptor subunit TctC